MESKRLLGKKPIAALQTRSEEAVVPEKLTGLFKV